MSPLIYSFVCELICLDKGGRGGIYFKNWAWNPVFFADHHIAYLKAMGQESDPAVPFVVYFNSGDLSLKEQGMRQGYHGNREPAGKIWTQIWILCS